MSFYKKEVLPNGLRVVSETIPTVRSASVGIWVGAGSTWESEALQGTSHLIEHMLFKGTRRRSSRELAEEIDGRGGSLNAFTAKEQTCYYCRVLDEHLPVAVDVLADMIQNSLFDPVELEKEKGVIAEEIKMYEDVPEELVHDLFVAAAWPQHPLGRPVVGTAAAVTTAPRPAILEYMQAHYTPENMVVAVAGHVEHERFTALVAEALSSLSGRRAADPPSPPPGVTPHRALVCPKDSEQVHLVVGGAGLALEHDDIWALHVANTILGGGSTSRLFQQIREERGLAYSVYSYTSSFSDGGLFGVYAGTSPANYLQVVELINQELDRAGRSGLSTREVEKAKDQLKGQLMLSLESTSGRMTRLGRGELAFGRVLSPDEVLARIQAVTPEQVAEMCARLLGDGNRVLAAVGPLGDNPPLAQVGFPEVTHG